VAKRQPGRTAEARKQIIALIVAAAGGRKDLVWLDAAIRKAGYVGIRGTGAAATESGVERVVLWIVSGLFGADLEGACVSKLGIGPAGVKDIIAEARKRITIAADFARDEQIGKAVLRLEDIYAKSMTTAGADPRTALQAQKELNHLMGLYPADESGEGGLPEDEDDARRRLEVIASYLLPLKLAGGKYPVEEHARVASEILRDRANRV